MYSSDAGAVCKSSLDAATHNTASSAGVRLCIRLGDRGWKPLVAVSGAFKPAPNLRIAKSFSGCRLIGHAVMIHVHLSARSPWNGTTDESCVGGDQHANWRSICFFSQCVAPVATRFSISFG